MRDDGETTRASSPARVVSAPELSSSPQPPFSSEADAPVRSTPPSSPPPAPAIERSSPPPPVLDINAKPPRRPVFALFKRQAKLKHSASAPAVLSGPSQKQNAQSAAKLPSPPQPRKPRLVQMQLDLAAAQRRTCSCGMEYIPSNASDAALHRKFHAVNAGGVDCTKGTIKQLREKLVWSGGEEGAFIACVGRRDALALRRKASEVLTVVNTELAAVPIEDGELWGQMMLEKGDGEVERCDRFKVYLYMRGQKCVGACLAERVCEAYAVLAQDKDKADELQEQEQEQVPSASSSHSSSISVSTTPAAVLLGISRIWVSKQFRKKGLARTLLDCARANFTYGLTVDKRQIAFSQPTESGGRLARRYFGCEAGWLVYME